MLTEKQTDRLFDEIEKAQTCIDEESLAMLWILEHVEYLLEETETPPTQPHDVRRKPGNKNSAGD